jgi:hypothetical protein
VLQDASQVTAVQLWNTERAKKMANSAFFLLVDEKFIVIIK